MLRREALQVVKGILRIGVRVVGHDGDRADADVAQCLRLLYQAADHCLHIGTVIADEGNERALGPARVGERPGAAVDAGQREIARLPAELADAGRGSSRDQSPDRCGVCYMTTVSRFAARVTPV